MSEPIILPYDDYTQSANTLFHFMTKIDYLKSALANKSLVPRYCMENIEYLNLRVGDTKFSEVAVLQKCFCDIPFHKLTETFSLNGVGDAYETLSDAEKLKSRESNTHPAFYGEFAIAFSKSWGEDNHLQPVHYLNENSPYSKDFSELFDFALNSTDIPDEFSNDTLHRLSLIKPLRGAMKRPLRRDTGENINIEFYKNFHDEKEWRYVPSIAALTDAKMEPVIANCHMFKLLQGVNNGLFEDRYKPLRLTYNYDDIRYIIVPDASARVEIINTIMSFPTEQSDNSEQQLLQKYILISKVLVLNEIRRDW